MSVGTVLLVLLVLVLFGVIPGWSHSKNWGYAPGGVVGLLLAVSLSMAANGGIADALGASGPRLSPSHAASPPSLDRPVGGTVPDAPAGSPRNPNSTPMPAPAPTIHYAHSGENYSEQDQCAVLSRSKRSVSFFTTA